ncbi:MAG TPA: DUF2530 domain-containing protein [Jiangellales bacterium]|nr:DUF2530 domain-containing protein [Jiangellales bacterium]
MERRHGPAEDPPELRPVDVDGVRTVAIITVLWALAFVVLAFFRADLDEAGRGWWIWACLAGVGLGLLGLEYCRKRRDAIARAELYEEADAGFDDAGDWADGELAALAAEEDPLESGFDQPTQEYSPDFATPPAAPLPVNPPMPPVRPHAGLPTGQHTGEHPRAYPATGPDTGEHPRAYPVVGHDTGELGRTHPSGGRAQSGYATGEFPPVTSDIPPITSDIPPVTGDIPPWGDEPRAAPASGALPPVPHGPPIRSTRPAPPSAPPRQPPYPPEQAYAGTATPAGYSPDPDRSRRHPRDEELARRYREEQARAAAGGYEPPSYPEFLQDEAARGADPIAGPDWAHEPPAASGSPVGVPAIGSPEPAPPVEPEPPSKSRRAPGLDSEFFTDEPPPDTKPGADFLLDDDEEPGDYRGRRARRD